MSERTEFEAWALQTFGCGIADELLLERDDDGYADERVSGAWAAWQHWDVTRADRRVCELYKKLDAAKSHIVFLKDRAEELERTLRKIQRNTSGS